MQPDRVDAPRSDPPPVPLRRRFEELLRGRLERPSRKSPAPPRRQRTATPARVPRVEARAARASGEQRSQARREMDTSARLRLADGAMATDQATARLEVRAADLLTAALQSEETARNERAPGVLARPSAPLPALEPSGSVPQGSPAPGNASGPGGPPQPGSEGRIERALALVERIERLVRSGRPSLALTLRGGAAGELEIQRVARGAIALRLSSPRPPSSKEIAELRQALEARGLSVRSFEARRLTAETAGGEREDRDAIAAEAEKRGGRGARVP
ncbi:MAG TPA: hypothetical protein VFD38_14505 [Myxococcaceae bacterium]|nr:hypothetical protein [Myxococcaceae bacterium]